MRRVGQDSDMYGMFCEDGKVVAVGRDDELSDLTCDGSLEDSVGRIVAFLLSIFQRDQVRPANLISNQNKDFSSTVGDGAGRTACFWLDELIAQS